MKKLGILSLILCVSLIFVGCKTPNDGDTEACTHAYDDENDKVCNLCGHINSTLPSFVISETETTPGSNNVKVSVAIKNNPGISSIVLSLAFDNTALELTKIEYNEAMGGQTIQPKKLESPVTLYWINGLADTTGDWIFATLCFNVSESASGEYDIQLSYSPDNVYNIAEENLNFEKIQGKVIVK